MNKEKFLRVPYGSTVHGQEEIDAVVDVLKESTQMGSRVNLFEQKISKLFDEEVINDHIAFRTFNLSHCNVAKQKEFLEQFGYKFGGDYFFEQKRLWLTQNSFFFTF